MSKSKEELAEESYKLNGYDIEIDKKCPRCNSKRISKINTYQVWVEENLSTGKTISKNTNLNPFARIFHNYKCRRCNWVSIIFDE